MDWYKKFTSELSKNFSWIVNFTHKDGKQEEVQIAGESAQDCADYIRKTHDDIAIINFIAKIDDSWT